MRKLRRVQQDVFASLRRHGSWSLGCGWLWDTPSNTMRIMDSLVRAGYACTTKSPGERTVYHPANPKAPLKTAVILSEGRVVDGEDVSSMLKQQHAILLKLSKVLVSLLTEGENNRAQKMIADANMLGLEVADRLKEIERK